MPKATKIKIPREMTRKHVARAEREARQRAYLMIGLAAVLVIALGLVGYAFLEERVLKYQQPVATVNGKAITAGEFEKAAKLARFQLTDQLGQYQAQLSEVQNNPQYAFLAPQFQQQISSLQAQLTDSGQLGYQVMNNMIADELVRQEAARRKITLGPNEVQTFVETRMFNFYRIPPTATPVPPPSPTPAQTDTPEPTPTGVVTPTATPGPTSTPGPTATPVTEQGFNDQFTKYLANMAKFGATKDDLYRSIEAYLLRTKLQDAFVADQPKSGEQIAFREIDFQRSTEAQLAGAELKSGQTFDALYQKVDARQVMSSTAHTESWIPTAELGDTGFFSPEAVQVLKTLSISQTSEVITNTITGGYSVFQVTGREVRELSENQHQTAGQKAFDSWLSTQTGDPKVVNLFNNRYLKFVPPQPTISA